MPAYGLPTYKIYERCQRGAVGLGVRAGERVSSSSVGQANDIVDVTIDYTIDMLR
jgi:hypothetical protein